MTITSTSMVRVMVPSSYSNKLCGMCGNFDSEASNDLTTADGTDVSSKSAAERGALIAGSYLIESDIM